jgi:hypothetical protein
MRTGLLFLSALIALALAPSAAAAEIPTPTFSTAGGDFTPALGSRCSPQMCADAALGGPDMPVTPGTEIKVTLHGDADSVHAQIFGGPGGLQTPTGWRQYTIPIPADLQLPTWFAVFIRTHADAGTWDAGFAVRLVAAPQDLRTVPSPPATIAAGSLRLDGRRLAIGVACPATAAKLCSGTLTLKTPSLRVARVPYQGVQPGTTVTLQASVRAAVPRHLRRHRTKALRAVLTPAGGAPAVTTTRLR